MAAYAALVSLMHIIDKIAHHPSPPIFIDKQQAESLTEIITFLQAFLEAYYPSFSCSDEADPLEMRIADAAYAAEDVIESHIVDVIKLCRSSSSVVNSRDEEFLEGSLSGYCDEADPLEMPIVDAARAAEEVNSGEEVSCIDFYRDLQQVIEEMNVIKKEAMETSAEAQMQRKVSSTHAGSFTSSSTVKESVMVGFDDVKLQLLDKLVRGHRSRQIIPIIGMGGIGKTTLARNIFEHALVKEHFDLRSWVTISQTYNVSETLRQVLYQVGGGSGSENELGVKLHKHLFGRRYLIILDDMWDVEAWDQMRVSFPDNNNGSRVIVTTRQSKLAAVLTDSNTIGMRLLDGVSSWNLFSKTVFGEQSFPPQFEEIGKKIVKKCNGLPLSIAVIGGLLAKSELTLEYWEHIGKNLISIVNSENDEYYLRALKLSYDHLPTYLKPCFLYMGVLEEDRVVKVSTLVELWVSEGFLKPIINKSLETVAEDYLKELVERNLILVHELGSLGNIKRCKMHDLLRDLSLKEAQKQRFYYVLRQRCPRGIDSQRRIVIPESTSNKRVCNTLEPMPLVRSCVCGSHQVPQFLNCRLFRTLAICADPDEYYLQGIFQLVNLRYLYFRFRESFQIPSSITMFWNLHTLFVDYRNFLSVPIEIWKMHQLKHAVFYGMYLPDPPSSHSDDIVIMENLEMLKRVIDFNLNEEVVKRIPNIKKLEISYLTKLMDRLKCLSYLQCLSKLENLRCYTNDKSDEYLQSITFPHSLRKLYLRCGKFPLEEVLEKIGSLPLLEKLTLGYGQFATRSWEIVEGQFPCLKYMRLYLCADMERWTLEGSCLPRLEQLHLSSMKSLEEFPLEIGEIPTLRSIGLYDCSESMARSLKTIVEEQEDLQEDLSFHVQVTSRDVSQELQSSATPNFRVIKSN